MNEKKLFTYTEAAEILNISPNTIRCWASLGKISYTKVGRLARLTEAQIQQIIDAGKVEVSA